MASRLNLYESSSDEDEEAGQEPTGSEETTLGKKRPRSETSAATTGIELENTSDRPAKSAKVGELVDGEAQAPVRETSAISQKQHMRDHRVGVEQVGSKQSGLPQRHVAKPSTAARSMTAS